MLLLLSPAKSLDFDTPLSTAAYSKPLFVQQATELMAQLTPLTVAQVAEFMELSEALAQLNVRRFAAWVPRFTARNSRPALLAFDGDVYDGLQAKTLTSDDLQWAQQHLCILSGLYGVLRPLDRMQPYRLEMGRPLAVGQHRNLYQFWQHHIAPYLNQRAQTDPSPVIVNLASHEYFKAVDRKLLKAPVVDCVFEDYQGGRYKVISFFAKRARGLMARYVIQQRLSLPHQLQAFDQAGYAFCAAASQADRLVFRRQTP